MAIPSTHEAICMALEAERIALGLTSFEKLAHAKGVTASSVSRWRRYGDVSKSAEILIPLILKHVCPNTHNDE
jgi:transcriptional regulator with XRE-family HTH domain